MKENKINSAWVVLVPTDNLSQSALLSGKMIKKTKSKAIIVALVSWTVSRDNVRLLNSTFDLVITPDTEVEGHQFENTTVEDLLLASTMSLDIFYTKIILAAGILVRQNLDNIFQDELPNKTRILMTDKSGLEWRVIRMAAEDNGKIIDIIKKRNGFLGKCTTVCDEVTCFADLDKHLGKEMIFVDELVAGNLLRNMEKTDPQKGLKIGQHDWVAVVGMSCRFPGANSLDEYWDILNTGKNTRSPPPADRSSLLDTDSGIVANFLKCPIDQFDGPFFRISPSEAAYTDPQARLLLEVSWEAFEDAKINPETFRGENAGVFYGSWMQDYKEALTEAHGSFTSCNDLVRKYIGNGFGSSAAKLSYFYGFTGPNIATESGCSSSMIAVDMAIKSLQRKECPVAVACGANLLLYVGHHPKLWAEDGLSKTFDAGADGYARAEGIAALIMKRYEDAVNDGDNIHGILLGSASSQEGLSKSFGSPTVDSEWGAMSRALKIANVDPSQVDYVEAHATGTAVGDPIEATAIVKAYSSQHKREAPLWIGSGKTNIGHTESCSGMAGLIKVMLAMKHQVIPQHVNFTSLNPVIDLSPIPGKIPLEKVPWTRNPEKPRIAGVSSFGITGTDVHMIIQEPPQPAKQKQDLSLETDESRHLLTLSAKSESALKIILNNFQAHLESTPDTIQDICFTANTCRPHYQHRAVAVGSTKQEMISNLKHPITTQHSPRSTDKICFIFPGNGESMEMTPFVELYQTQSYFRNIIDESSKIYQNVTGNQTTLVNALLRPQVSNSSDEWYDLLPTCQYALAKLWIHWGIQPNFVIGHSVGELAALLVSETITLENMYKFVQIIPSYLQGHNSFPQVSQVTFESPKLPYISSATGNIVGDNELNASYLFKILRDCSNFTEACTTAQDRFFPDIFLEMGCESALTMTTQNNLKENGKSTSLTTFPKNGIMGSIAELYKLGVNPNWKNIYENKSLQKVSLPHYPFQRKSYWFERKHNKSGMEFGRPSQMYMVHPFLGIQMEAIPGLENITIFQNNWFTTTTLSNNQTKFVADHCIGNKVIFPGAAFLEMILSAGRLPIQSENGAGYSVKDFRIHAPLLVEESSQKRIQCVVNTESRKTSVYSVPSGDQLEMSGFSWRLHATAEICTEEYLEEFTSLDIATFKDNESISVTEFYDKINQLGLTFGESFKSLKNFTRNPEGYILAEVTASAENQTAFLCHPILIDGMIQAFMAIRNPDLNRLHIPVKIRKFSLLSAEALASDKWYICCKNGSSSVYLLNHSGKVLAVMESPELIATSVQSVLNSAESQGTRGNKPVDNHLFDLTWQPSKFYQMQKYSDDQNYDDATSKISEMEKELKSMNSYSEQESKLNQDVNRLCYLYVVKMLFDLEWNPKQNPESLNLPELGIPPGLIPAFNHYMTYLKNDKIPYKNVEQVEKEIEEISALATIKDYAAMETIHSSGINLAAILTGNMNIHKMLFGEKNLATHYYQTTRFLSSAPQVEKFTRLLVSLAWNERGENKVLRILELGAGTGMFTQKLVPALNEMGVQFEYHFTDISPTLLTKAASDLLSEEDRKCCQFKIFNLEVDPLKQGFPPGYFDFVIALDVLHATRDLRKTLANISMVTRHGGRIILGETEKPIWEADVAFGALEGYWLFEDAIRKGHCTVDSPTWLRILKENGFGGDQSSILHCEGQMSTISARKTGNTTPKKMEKTWAIFHIGKEDAKLKELKQKLENETGRRVNLVGLETGILSGRELQENIGSYLDKMRDKLEGILMWALGDDEGMTPRDVLEPMLYISQYLLQAKIKILPRFLLVTKGCWQVNDGDEMGEQGAIYAMACGFMRNVRVELPGIMSKSVDIERGTEGDEMVRQLMTEMWLDENEIDVAYRDGVRLLRRMMEKNLRSKPLQIPEDPEKEFHIELPKSKLIKDLRFAEMENVSLPRQHQVKVEIRCVSLNFRDVFTVLKPIEGFTSLGLDFSGVVTGVGEGVTKWKLGDGVFGCEWINGCMRSHVKTDENLLMPVPGNMTFGEAATLPAVFFTAWYCMKYVAKLKKGKTILVHAASGGVGLAAIQIARLMGVRVIGTAGSERKRRYVRGQGVEHVFNSRTLDFEQEVMRMTNGKGVDMVLNCLTGPGFKEAGLAVCRDGGNFVEISKLDVWTEEEVGILRPLVKYDVVDVRQADTNILREMMDKLTLLVKQGEIKPLPYKNFQAGKVGDALGILQKAKQIGKVIVTMPEIVEGQRKNLMFNDRSTYLITGGKGAIGFAVCKWMIGQGAKYVILVGRNEASPEVTREIKELNEEFGCRIICKEMDISEFDQCRNLISHEIPEILGIPPLRGIHHSAGILSDKMIANQDWSNFSSVFKAKVDGAWNLHRATLSIPLEHFILYSSAATSLGHVGQSNYVAANAFMDNLAQYRNSLNLPALSVAWGTWKAGLAADVDLAWVQSFSLDEGVESLQGIMQDLQHNQCHIVAGKFNFTKLLKIVPHYKNSLFQHITFDKNVSQKKDGSDDNSKNISIFDDFKKLEDSEGRKTLVRNFVITVLCDTLGIEKDEVKDDVEFSEMGMDSLMSIEFTNKIFSGIDDTSQGATGSGGSNFIELGDHATVNKMEQLICSYLERPAV